MFVVFRLVILLALVSSSILSFATIIRGIIKDNNGSPLAFATIYIKETGSGTTSNEEGNYELVLQEGDYQISFQFLGHETQIKKVKVEKEVVELNVILILQTFELGLATVTLNNEDPAYSIMRKAISKAKYHSNQLDTYTAEVYIKGTGKLIDYPWLAKGMIEKEGIKKNQAFVSESISKIKFTRPNKFEEKVISIRSNGSNNNTSPTGFIRGSFYDPIISDNVSPLSPSSFSYYKFNYIRTFTDRQFQVNEIKVTPRSRGDNVFEGTIFIIEDLWSIHSLNLTTLKQGISLSMNQFYAPIEDNVWLPVSNQFAIAGKFFGFEFQYKYLATLSKYSIKLNPKLVLPKLDIDGEKLSSKSFNNPQENPKKNIKEVGEQLSSGKEISRKDLQKFLKFQEKEDNKVRKEPDLISDINVVIDSNAYKTDSAYWDRIRPVPLLYDEIIGYRKMDSIQVVQQKKMQLDSLKNNGLLTKKFQPLDLLIGAKYKISDHSDFKILIPETFFNTIEGFYIYYRLKYSFTFSDSNKTKLSISPGARYSFARNKFSGLINLTLNSKNYKATLEGGRMVRQLNQDEPILPFINSFTTLILEKNLIKLYERDYFNISYLRKINNKHFITTNFSWDNRTELSNQSNRKLIDDRKIDYSSNRPENLELTNTGFENHQAFIGSISITTKPWLKFGKYNQKKYEINSSSPSFTFLYRKGFSNILSSDVDFDLIELASKYSFKNGSRGLFTFNFKLGIFINSSQLYFPDYFHFMGNKTPFTTTDPSASFRLLDYYTYSTAQKYFSANSHYSFRKFLLSSEAAIRMLGIKESVFINYLATPLSKNYTELGYSIDGIFRSFRLEGVFSFQNLTYRQFGFRIGFSPSSFIQFQKED